MTSMAYAGIAPVFIGGILLQSLFDRKIA